MGGPPLPPPPPLPAAGGPPPPPLPKSKKLQAKGEEPLDRYEFDYLLLCNKICGKSHYNMQMKIIVESEEDYNEWLKEQKLFKNSLVQN